MAIKQLKFVKSNGKSALGIHEYIARLGENRDNADKCLVQGYEHLPEFARDDPLFFWQMTDEHERANAKACTHVVVALPRELDVEAQTRMVEDFVQRNFKGCPLSWAIHEGKDQHNPHAHLQICERRIETEREARFSEKRFFKRNGVKKDRTLNERKFCSRLYRQYAGSINHHLQKAGSRARIRVEARNNAFEGMSLSEKMQKNFDQELTKLEKRQAEEMAELLKNLNKEEKEKQGEEKNELSRREQDLTGTESRNTQRTGKSGTEHEQPSQETLSGGSNESARRGQERSSGSEEYFEGLSGDNDSGDGRMESETGSGENAKSDQDSATIGARLLDLARTTIKALFRNKWLQKFKLFKKEKLSEEIRRPENQKVLETKIDRGIKNSTLGIKMTILKTQRNRTTRKLDEKIEIQKEVNRLQKGLREKFINFQGLDIRSDYKTVIIARQEVKNLFGKLKSSQNVIIGLHTHFHMANKKKSASQCAIEDVRDETPKSSWKVYEIEVEPSHSLEEVLKRECNGFKLDQNLIQRLGEEKQKHQKITDSIIEDIKLNGLYAWRPKISLNEISNDFKNDLNRGLNI